MYHSFLPMAMIGWRTLYTVRFVRLCFFLRPPSFKRSHPWRNPRSVNSVDKLMKTNVKIINNKSGSKNFPDPDITSTTAFAPQVAGNHFGRIGKPATIVSNSSPPSRILGYMNNKYAKIPEKKLIIVTNSLARFAGINCASIRLIKNDIDSPRKENAIKTIKEIGRASCRERDSKKRVEVGL